MKKYRRNRVKDAVIVASWLILLIPILPFALIVAINDYAEKISDWYDGVALQPIRNWRNRWNPEKYDK